MSQPASIAIIGAGMAGLTLGRALGRSLGARATVRLFDKSHGPGGRMATRRRADQAFDHGAQYFTVRDAAFRALLSDIGQDGPAAVAPWAGEIATLEPDGAARPDGRPGERFVGVPTMNALPKRLSAGLDLTANAAVTAIEGVPGRWTLIFEDGAAGPFDWVVTTAPAPQSALLLPGTFQHHPALAAVRMNACFTLMVAPQAPFDPPFVAARPQDPILDWIGRNDTKPGRTAAPCLTVNARADWSDAHLDDPAEAIRQTMLDALCAYVSLSQDDRDAATLHRWKYANVAQPAGQSFLLDASAQLAACGDWCIAGRVEAAVVSATALSRALHTLVQGAAA